MHESLTGPPGAWRPLTRLAKLARRPLERFLRVEASSGLLLLGVAAFALVWANSPWAASYFRFWHTQLGFRVGAFVFERNLEWFVNDGLMVIFFFVVGLEIRRELHHGELSEWRRAALPFAAALGGMIAPALLYLSIAGSGRTHSGWGVPMATDIAFALGVLTLLGHRVPPALRVMLLALAVIDDLGAVAVIALFYSSGVAWPGVLTAIGGVAGIIGLQAFGVRRRSVYVIPGIVVWAGTYASGVHPTIAGVVVGMLTPVQVWLGTEGFVRRVRSNIDAIAQAPRGSAPSRPVNKALRDISVARREALSPAEGLIDLLHPWVAYLIMPIFALANAGVALKGVSFDPTTTKLVVAVGIGLVIGKPLGIVLACQVTLGLRLSALPRGITLRHLIVLGAIAGVGFTMALFVAQLAFDDARLLNAAKLGVLLASGVAGILGLAIGRAVLGRTAVGAARTADEAEASTET
ncbi:MAG: Na+/H+ antiporter NhaA [Myxococcales bacterium]